MLEKGIIVEEYALSQIIRSSKGNPLFIVSKGTQSEQFTVSSIYFSAKQRCWSIHLRCVETIVQIVTNLTKKNLTKNEF